MDNNIDYEPQSTQQCCGGGTQQNNKKRSNEEETIQTNANEREHSLSFDELNVKVCGLHEHNEQNRTSKRIRLENLGVDFAIDTASDATTSALPLNRLVLISESPLNIKPCDSSSSPDVTYSVKEIHESTPKHRKKVQYGDVSSTSASSLDPTENCILTASPTVLQRMYKQDAQMKIIKIDRALERNKIEIAAKFEHKQIELESKLKRTKILKEYELEMADIQSDDAKRRVWNKFYTKCLLKGIRLPSRSDQ